MEKNSALPRFTFPCCDSRADIDMGKENLQASPKTRNNLIVSKDDRSLKVWSLLA